MIGTPNKLMFLRSGYSAIMLTQPRQCPGPCRAMHYWFINRHGRTLCVTCDGDVNKGDVYDAAA